MTRIPSGSSTSSAGHVETQIAFERVLDVLGLLGIFGRVADDHVEPPLIGSEPPQDLEHIASLKFGCCQFRFNVACWRASSIAAAELSTPRVAAAPALAALSEKPPEKQNRSSTRLPRQ